MGFNERIGVGQRGAPLTPNISPSREEPAFAGKNCKYRIRMFVQLSDSSDGFLHQLATEGIEAFRPIELGDISKWLHIDGLGWYFDDAYLTGDFENDVVVLVGGHCGGS